MAIISVPGHETQRFRKQTIRELFARAGQGLSDTDRYVLAQGEALDGLFFEMMDSDRQRHRIASALVRAADAYRAELLGTPDIGESDQSRAAALGELSLTLTELASRE
ncbi:hypothetical protein [Amycolatopsis samaneae]|uniref:Uncharacterized protein n=1 Tax=Amycolatopsis samaneae TaxID=664691 RepID=A0ABW5GX88_9PSEU